MVDIPPETWNEIIVTFGDWARVFEAQGFFSEDGKWRILTRKAPITEKPSILFNNIQPAQMQRHTRNRLNIRTVSAHGSRIKGRLE